MTMESLSPEESSQYTRLVSRIQRSLASLFTGQSLKAKAIRGGAWLGSGSVAEQAARFFRNLILVRLLIPAAFGTAALVTSTGLILQAFTEVGVREALVQSRRGSEYDFMNATWWMAFARALFVCMLVFITAPWVASFYGNSELIPLLRVAILGLVLEGAMSARAYVALKEMRFSRWALAAYGGSVLGILITIALCFYIRNVWALVLGTVSESLARCILSYALCPWIPSFRVKKEHFRELFRYSRGVVGLPILMLIFLRTDVFVLGKLVPASQLGLYTMGISIGQVPAVFVSNLLYHISLSTLSQIQDDKLRTNRVVLKVTSLVVAFGAPALAFTFFCGSSVLALVYGKPYAAMGGALFFALCTGMISIVNAQLTSVFYSAGEPALHRRCVATMAVLMVLLVYPFSKWLGPQGAQLAALISVAAGFGLQLERVRIFTDLRVASYVKVLIRSAAPSLAVIIVCLAARLLPAWSRPLPSIGFGAVGCLLAYALGCIMLMRRVAEGSPAG
jgi:O-antigen/teichoic acid export membrane protein